MIGRNLADTRSAETVPSYCIVNSRACMNHVCNKLYSNKHNKVNEISCILQVLRQQIYRHGSKSHNLIGTGS